MARTLNGSSQYLTNASTGYLGSSAAFTVAFWIRPDSLTPASLNRGVIYCTDGTDEWGVAYTTSGQCEFYATGYGGSDPTASSTTAAFSSIDLSHGKRVLYRYDGTTWVVWTGSRTGGLVQKTINASISFSIAALTGGTNSTYVGYQLGAGLFDGAIAEVAIWSSALSDADAELYLRGTAADRLSAATIEAYWPLRGTNSPEPDYTAIPATTSSAELTLAASPGTEAHPPVYGLDEQPMSTAAWCAEIQHGDGTIYAASMELAEPVDVDVLGRIYPGRILNGDSVAVSKTINEGIVAPGNTTVILRNDTVRSPQEISGLAAWLEADQIRTASDGDTVADWYDMSGCGRNMQLLTASGSGGTGPTFDADGVNSLPTLLFDATTETYRASKAFPTDSSSDFTMLVCFTRADTDTTTKTAVGGFSSLWRIYTGSGSVKLDCGSTLTLGSAKAIGVPHIVSVVNRTSTSLSARLDGGSWQTATPTTWPGTLPVLGSGPTPANEIDGTIPVFLVWNRVLGEDELRRVEAYVASKYGDAGVAHAAITPRREFRGTRVILRRYERTSHELVTELVGKIASVDWSIPGRAAFTLTGAASDVLNERIPKALVNVDEHETATDLLAPIPVGFGDFWVSAPFVGYNDTSTPGEYDFAATHIIDADGSEMSVELQKVLFDIYSSVPGLETATSWEQSPGTTPTKTASVTNKLDLPAAADRFYEVGTPVRLVVSGSTIYTHVTAYTAGSPNTVTLADSIVTANPTTVEVLAGAYLIDKSTYTSNGDAIAVVRFVGTGKGGGVVVFGNNATLTNPADVIDEILRNGTWGLGQTTDSALFTQAATDFTSAGLGSACNYALAGDRQQRTARTVLGEILSMRGAWLDLQEDGSWGIYVDKVPAWSQSRTYAIADKRFPQIAKIGAHTRVPLSSVVGKLKLRYRKKGRSRTNEGVTSWIAPSDFEFQNNYTVSTVGADRVVSNPWLDKATNAGRVVVYQGKRLATEDESLDVQLGFSGRNVQLGEVLRLVVPHSQVDGDYRVVGYTRGLTTTTVRTVGYSSAIFDFNASEVEYDAASGTNTSADTIDRDESSAGPAVGPNQVLNANFALGLGNTYTPAATKADAATVPGWIISEGDGGSTDIGALSVSRAAQWVGRHYVSIQIDGTSGNPRLRTNSNLTTSATTGGLLVDPGEAYIVSCYMAQSGASKASDAGTAFKFEIEYYQADGTASAVTSTDTPITRSAGTTTGPDTGSGPAMRWWGVTRAPSDAVYARLNIEWTATGTYYVGAVAFNQVNRFLYTPPPWSNTTEQSYGPLS